MTCPFCAAPVGESNYFCANCGKKLKEKPVSTSFTALVGLYLVSVFLPPFGLGLTIRYLKSTEPTAKTMGIISLLLTILALMLGVWWAMSSWNGLRQQIEQLYQLR